MIVASLLVLLVLGLCLALDLARHLARRTLWWHWTNENELAPGRLGSPLRHGRAFFHVRDHLFAGGSVFRVEWSLARSSTFGIGFGANRHDGATWSCHAGIGVAALYLAIESRLLRKWVPADDGRRFDCSIHDGAIWLCLWGREMSWDRRDPWYVRTLHFSPGDFFLGAHRHREREIASSPVLVPMPERPYRATVTLLESSWKRPRSPFTKRVLRAKIEMEKGEQIPTPGKGENSWDCDEDATYSLCTPAATVPEAVAAMVETVLRTRARYGGPAWRPAAPPKGKKKRREARA